MKRSRRRTTGTWRRWVFFVWIGLTAALAAYVAVAAPFAAYFHDDFWIAAVVIPPLMIILLGSGLGWLIWMSVSGRSKNEIGTSRR